MARKAKNWKYINEGLLKSSIIENYSRPGENGYGIKMRYVVCEGNEGIRRYLVGVLDVPNRKLILDPDITYPIKVIEGPEANEVFDSQELKCPIDPILRGYSS